jgi:hypothetical protein
MQTAGKKHHKKHKKTARKHHAKSNKKIPLGIPIQKIPEMKPMKSLRQTLKNNLEEIQKSLKPKSLLDIRSSIDKDLVDKRDRDFLKSHKELLPQSGGGSDILTYEQNTYQNDPQYSMADTRHMYSEQQTMHGGSRRKTMCKKCGKKHGKKCGMKSW